MLCNTYFCFHVRYYYIFVYDIGLMYTFFDKICTDMNALPGFIWRGILFVVDIRERQWWWVGIADMDEAGG